MSSATERTGTITAGQTEESTGATERSPRELARLASRGVERGKQAVEGVIADRPAAAAVLSFVLGAGVGTLVGAALFERPPGRRRREAEGLIERIAETVSRSVRDNLPKSLGR